MKNQFIPLCYLAQNAQNTHFRELIPGQWCEGQTLLFHEQKSIDKIDTACHIIRGIAENLADTHILYIDAENSAPRLVANLGENTHLSVYRPTYDEDTLNKDYADLVISAIETAVKETDIRIFIVDSINRIAAASFGRNASPVHIMKKLVALQMRYNISIMVIAHTDSRSTREALVALADTTLTPEHTPSPTPNSSEHTPSNNQYTNPPITVTDANISPAISPISENSENPNSSDTPYNTHQLTDDLYINPDLPRAERRRIQKANYKLQHSHLLANR